MAFKEYNGLNLSQVADEVLADWEKNRSFEKSISLRKNASKFIFYEGPPSANGMPGIHHVMARSIKDIFCRYKTLKGFQVDRKAGWDTHGLPIELSVEKDLGITKEDIGTKISVEDYNKACKKAVMKYTDVWNDLTKKMGSAIVEGYQGGGKIDEKHVAACLKHYVGYGSPRSGRDRTPALIPQRTMEELNLPPFEEAIKKGALTVMINSGEVNGIPGHKNKYLIMI